MSENTGLKTDTKFKPGQSGNPAGKQRGVRHKATQTMQVLLQGELEAITRKAVELALDGDTMALKLCLDRLAPPLKPVATPITLDLPAQANLTETARALVGAAASGDVPPDVAAQLVSAVASAAKVEELEQIRHRLEALEHALKVGV